MQTTRLSSKGQVIIPQSIREHHHWHSGVEFSVIDTEEGILLTPLKPFTQTSTQQLLGCVTYKGPKKSLRDMKDGIAKKAKKQHI